MTPATQWRLIAPDGREWSGAAADLRQITETLMGDTERDRLRAALEHVWACADEHGGELFPISEQLDTAGNLVQYHFLNGRGPTMLDAIEADMLAAAS